MTLRLVLVAALLASLTNVGCAQYRNAPTAQSADGKSIWVIREGSSGFQSVMYCEAHPEKGKKQTEPAPACYFAEVK